MAGNSQERVQLLSSKEQLSQKSRLSSKVLSSRHQCQYCKKILSSKSQLLIHNRTHTGEKPYECKSCPSKFARKSSLVSHTRTHTGERPYKCKTCNASFAHAATLLCHARSHTGEKPFECQFCDYGAAVRSAIIRHERIHTGEKPYKCDNCHMSFTDRSTLRNHKRIHNRERRYKCKLCDYSASARKRIASHELTDVGQKPTRSKTYAVSCAQVSNLKSQAEMKKKPSYKCPFRSSSAKQVSNLKTLASVHRHSCKNRVGSSHSPCNCQACITKQYEVQMCPKSYDSIPQRGEEPYNFARNEGSTRRKCKACEFAAESDADAAVHMNALHNLPVVALRRLHLT